MMKSGGEDLRTTKDDGNRFVRAGCALLDLPQKACWPCMSHRDDLYGNHAAGRNQEVPARCNLHRDWISVLEWPLPSWGGQTH